MNLGHQARRTKGSRKVKSSGDRAATDLAMLLQGETSQLPLAEILAKFGRSRSTYYEKRRLFRDRGFEGLVGLPSGPRAPWRRTEEIERLIVAARMRDPTANAESIARDLARNGRRVSARSVERTLSRFGLTRWSRRKT